MFKSLLSLVTALLLSGCATVATAGPKTIVTDPARTVLLKGQVGPNALWVANRLVKLAGQSDQPIDLIINSPGGSIYAGLQLMSAIHSVQSRGIKVRCSVPVMAASMAFQILVHCDERYAFKFSLLLFHPARTGFNKGVTADELEYTAKELRALENKMIAQLLRKLRISRKTFDYHYKNETLWLAEDLVRVSPGVITLVDDIISLQDIFSLD